MMKKYIKGKFGLSKFMTSNSDVISSGANTLSGGINALDSGNEFGNKSTGTTIASSALSGAGLGTSILPGIGTAVGAVAGGLYGMFQANAQRKEEGIMKDTQDRNEKSSLLNSYAQKVRTNPELVNGSRDNQYYSGGGMIKRADGSSSKRGLWDNIRANKGSDNKPTSEMLKQEKKINKMAVGGEVDSPNVNKIQGKPLEKPLYEQWFNKGLDMLDYPHKKLIQAVGGDGNQMYSDLLNEKRKGSYYKALDSINPKINDVIGQAGDFFVDPIMLNKVKSVKGASTLVESGNKLYKTFNTVDKIADTFGILNNNKKAMGGEVDAKDSLGRTYSKTRNPSIYSRDDGKKMSYNQEVRKFIPIRQENTDYPNIMNNLQDFVPQKRRELINKYTTKDELSEYGSPLSISNNVKNPDLLYGLDVISGSPKITLDNQRRSSFDGGQNNMFLPKKLESNWSKAYLPELAHSYQYSKDVNNYRGVPVESKIDIGKVNKVNKEYEKEYSKKGSVEYQAHREIDNDFSNIVYLDKSKDDNVMQYYNKIRDSRRKGITKQVLPITDEELELPLSLNQNMFSNESLKDKSDWIKASRADGERQKWYKRPFSTIHPFTKKVKLSDLKPVDTSKNQEKWYEKELFAMGGEVDLHNSKSIGGTLHKLTNNDSYVQGKSHDEGGVKFPNEGVELEGGETMNDSFVFSKELGFADKHLSLIKNKQKLEKAGIQRPNDNKLINGLKLIDYRIQLLKQQQEETKANLGIDNDLQEKAKGGYLFKKEDLLKRSGNEEQLEETRFKELNFEREPDKRKGEISNSQIDSKSNNYDSLLLSGLNTKSNSNKNIKEIKSHLLSSGISENATKGILGNVGRESNFNPNAVGDNGNSYGLFQHNKSRKKELLNYLSANGLKSNDVKGQVNFTLGELNKSGLLNQLNNSKSPEEASDLFVSKFERPANLSNEINIRRNLTKQYRDGGKLKAVKTAYNTAMSNPTLRKTSLGLSAYSSVNKDLAKSNVNKNNDSLLEDVVEVIDPTGISSYDDVYREGKNYFNDWSKKSTSDKWTGGLGLGVEVAGALPIIGKLGKLGKGVKSLYKMSKTASALDTVSDLMSVNSMYQNRASYRTGGLIKYAFGGMLENPYRTKNRDSLKELETLQSNKKAGYLNGEQSKRLNQLEIQHKDFLRGDKRRMNLESNQLDRLIQEEERAKVIKPVEKVIEPKKPSINSVSNKLKTEQDALKQKVKQNIQSIIDKNNEKKAINKTNRETINKEKVIAKDKAFIDDNAKGYLAQDNRTNIPEAKKTINNTGNLEDLDFNLSNKSTTSSFGKGKLGSFASLAQKAVIAGGIGYGMYKSQSNNPIVKGIKDFVGLNNASANSDIAQSKPQVKNPYKNLGSLSQLTTPSNKETLINPIIDTKQNVQTTTTTQSKTPIRRTINNKSRAKTNVVPSTIDNKSINNDSTPSMAGGDRFNVNNRLDDRLTGNGVTPLSKAELASQRIGNIKMLSDEDRNKLKNKNSSVTSINSSNIATNLSQYGSDAVGLLRKYPNEPAPLLNSEISLQRSNLNANRASNQRDYSTALNSVNSLGSSNNGGVIGSLLGKKLDSNNQISQTENNNNSEISNKETMINSEIRNGNTALTNEYNGRKYNRNIDIQNANQSYLSNINEKSLMQTREKNQSNLDLAKVGLGYLGLDKGTTAKADSVLGTQMRETTVGALTNMLPKKKVLPTFRKGGMIAYK